MESETDDGGRVVVSVGGAIETKRKTSTRGPTFWGVRAQGE